MKRVAAVILAVTVWMCVLPVSAGVRDAIVGINPVVGRATPPQLVSEAVVAPGDLVRLLVSHDNFLWVDEDEEDSDGEGVAFDELLVARHQLTVFGGATCLDTPWLETAGGRLYIVARAVQEGENVPVQAAVQMGQRTGPVSQVTVSVRMPDPDTEGPGDGDGSGGEEPGDGENPGGEEPGDGGGSGGSDSGENPGDGSGSGANPGDGGGSGSGEERPSTTEGLQISGISDSFVFQEHLAQNWGSVLMTAPGERPWASLPASAFQWKNASGKTVFPQASAAVGMTQLSSVGARVSVVNNRNGAVIDSARLTVRSGTAGVELQMAPRVLSLEDVSFGCTVVLQLQSEQAEASVEGVLQIPVQHTAAGATELDLQEGAVIQPSGDGSRALLYLGQGIYLCADLKAGRRYAATAVQLEEQAPSDGEVWQIVLLGFNDTDIRFMRILQEQYPYLYHADGSYLGQAGEDVPFQEVFLARAAAPARAGGSTSTSGGSVIIHSSSQAEASGPEHFYEVAEPAREAVGAGEPPERRMAINDTDNPNTGR